MLIKSSSAKPAALLILGTWWPRNKIPPFEKKSFYIHITYVSLRLRVQNAVSPQPCVGKFRISLVLLNFLHCNFRLWFKTP